MPKLCPQLLYLRELSHKNKQVNRPHLGYSVHSVREVSHLRSCRNSACDAPTRTRNLPEGCPWAVPTCCWASWCVVYVVVQVAQSALLLIPFYQWGKQDLGRLKTRPRLRRKKANRGVAAFTPSTPSPAPRCPGGQWWRGGHGAALRRVSPRESLPGRQVHILPQW